jgi:hypothetical protein
VQFLAAGKNQMVSAAPGFFVSGAHLCIFTQSASLLKAMSESPGRSGLCGPERPPCWPDESARRVRQKGNWSLEQISKPTDARI